MVLKPLSKTFNIETAFLNDEESKRLQLRYPQIKLDPEEYCPTCLLARDYTWKGIKCRCDCSRQLQLYKHYLAAGIGVTYQRLNWEDYEVHDQMLWLQLAKYLGDAERYISRGVGLFFSGSYGTGKTMLANLILKEFVKRGYSCFATTFANAIQMFAAGFSDKGEMAYFQNKVINSRVLLVDDLGRELKSKLSGSTLDLVLRQRVQEGRPTMLTTNLSQSDMDSYDSAVLSLLKENSVCYEFIGDDYRTKSNQRTLAEIRTGETRPIF